MKTETPITDALEAEFAAEGALWMPSQGRLCRRLERDRAALIARMECYVEWCSREIIASRHNPVLKEILADARATLARVRS